MAETSEGKKKVYVHSHTKEDGTEVRTHYRSTPITHLLVKSLSNVYAILGCAPMELPLYWGIYLSFLINVDIITYRYLIYCFINYNFLEHPYKLGYCRI